MEYRWDTDTDILVATIRPAGVSEGLSGSIDIEGNDGAWLTLELVDGRLAAIEVAVWPDVKSVTTLPLPVVAGVARVRVPSLSSINAKPRLPVFRVSPFCNATPLPIRRGCSPSTWPVSTPRAKVTSPTSAAATLHRLKTAPSKPIDTLAKIFMMR